MPARVWKKEVCEDDHDHHTHINITFISDYKLEHTQFLLHQVLIQYNIQSFCAKNEPSEEAKEERLS